jgi:hypothetical protein
VGWALATHLRTDLPLEALEMAIWTRQRHGINDLAGLGFIMATAAVRAKSTGRRNTILLEEE